MWLTAKQVAELTGRQRPSAQARVLREAGIAYSMVAGRVFVMTYFMDKTPAAHVRRVFQPFHCLRDLWLLFEICPTNGAACGDTLRHLGVVANPREHQ